MTADATKGQPTKPHVLVVDDEANMRHMLAAMLGTFGYEVVTAEDGRDALQKVAAQQFAVILCDVKMPRMNGIAFLQEAEAYLTGSTVIMMSAYGTIDLAIEAMKLGAYDFISKPFKNDEIRLTIRKAEERERLRAENTRLRARIEGMASRYLFGEVVAKSKAMQLVGGLATKVAKFDTTVLITGESGTGKELVARAIHDAGDRSAKPLVAVNCGGIPEQLMESELFGHLKGAFTGADRNKPGLFMEAEGGTLFLDEIGELPVALQVKLLRVLQEAEIRPVGSTTTTAIDVRVIAATSKDLPAEMAEGRFREDLYYRLNVMPIEMPPLRRRSEDIPLLAAHFIEKFNTSLGTAVRGVSPAAMGCLLRYDWPGNVRQLENMIERAMVLSEGELLGRECFPPELLNTEGDARLPEADIGFSLKKAQRDLERRLITKALVETGGNRTRAAKLLEISHPSLLSKIKTYKIGI
ncbi:MAG: sigma-54 dependent transcriptional regulator [Desulfosarcinaceae bacterium]|nr:sigma-54 dependent transcriptional regulator [Desulfosarcinaceae bacterium]